MSRKHMILVRHVDDEDHDLVEQFCIASGLEARTFRPYRGEALPAPSADTAGVVVFGGPQSVEDHDSHPYLPGERAWVAGVIEAGVPLLGICLGAQLIVHALGGRVRRMPGGYHEWGIYEVRATEAGRGLIPPALHVIQAHNESFSLPPGTELIATGDGCAHQAFRYGDRVFGLQFHPECTDEMFRLWQAAPWAMFGQPGAQTKDAQDRLLAAHYAGQRDWFLGFLARLFQPAGALAG